MNSDDEKWVLYFLKCIFLFTGHCRLLASAFVTSGVCLRLDSISPGHLPGDGVQKRAVALGAAASLARGSSEGDTVGVSLLCF